MICHWCRLLLIGLPLFLVGVDMIVEKMGDLFSHYLIKHPKKVIAMIVIFGLGFISIIVEQNFVMVLSLGVGAMLTFGVY